MMRAASRPALAALSMATVATGIAAGICTMDSSESWPALTVVFTGPRPRRAASFGRDHARQMRRAPGARDDPAGRGPRRRVRTVHAPGPRCPDDGQLPGHREFVEGDGCRLADGQVRIAHDDADAAPLAVRSVHATTKKTHRGARAVATSSASSSVAAAS